VVVAVSTVVAVFMAAVSVAVVSMEDVLVVAVSTAVAFVAVVSAVAVSTAVAFVATVLIMTDSPMMSSSATSAFRGGGVTRTDITVMATTIIHTITMVMDTARTVITVASVTDTDGTVTTVAPVTDTDMAADQGISGIRGVGDKPGQSSLKIRDEATCECSKSVRLMFGDKFGE
jgi:hypothetical protein